MSSAPNDLVAATGHGEPHPLAIQWSGGLYTVSSWAILKDTTHLADANRFLTFAGDPARQPDLLPFGSLAKGASEKLSPDQVATSPSAPANLTNALHIEASFWLENGPKLEARFQDWLRAH
jgi:putative spermidine/putrescine transport system substrate-binding protein